MKKKNKRLFIIVLILLIGLGVTYAFLNVTEILNFGTNTISSSVECIDITFEDITEGPIGLTTNYPVEDTYALNNVKPITAKVKNNCTTSTEVPYTLVLSTIKENNSISDNQIRYNVKKEVNSGGLKEVKTTNYLNMLSQIPNGSNNYTLLKREITNQNLNVSLDNLTGYVIDSDVLESNDEIIYKIYLWIDYYEGDSQMYEIKNAVHDAKYDNDTMGKNFKSIVSILADVELDVKRPIELKNEEHVNYSGGMYRYQGQASEVDNNYICFGTTNKEECLNNQDKYMYRIIGVTPEGEIKVIKKEALEKTYQWWDDYNTDKTFPESKIYEAINGAEFLTNTTYVPSGWKDKISTHTWHYGDMWSGTTDGANQTGLNLYLTETGQKATRWYKKLSDDGLEGGTLYEVTSGPNAGNSYYYVEQSGMWKNKILDSKISLIYLHDYYLSVSDEANCQSSKNNYTICKTGWMHLSQNDTSAPSVDEWTMSRNGWNIPNGYFYVNYVNSTGYTNTRNLTDSLSIRPVFYLTKDIGLYGKGTIDKPYMINLDKEETEKAYTPFRTEELKSSANVNANQGGMYRYQGSSTEVNNNYICFGTTDKDECIKNQDKYMYRIIGITEDGELKLIKKTSIGPYPWNNTSYQNIEGTNNSDYNPNATWEDTGWKDSELYKRLNGLSTSNIFIGNTNYSYMNNNMWLNKISDKEWLYGPMSWSTANTTPESMYLIEIGQKEVVSYEKASVKEYNGGNLEEIDLSFNTKRNQGGVVCNKAQDTSNQHVTCYKVVTKALDEKTELSKIGLMNINDNYYAVQKGGFNCHYSNIMNPSTGMYKEEVNGVACEQSWLHLINNGTNLSEWTISRGGYAPNIDEFIAWSVYSKIYVSTARISDRLVTRPVFYLTRDIGLYGNGTIDYPYMIS